MTNGLTINRTKPAPLIGAVVIFVSLGGALMSSRANEPNESDAERSSGTAAARAFLQSLPEAKRAQAKLSFDSSERTSWNYVPTRRAGVALAASFHSGNTLSTPAALHVLNYEAEVGCRPESRHRSPFR